MISFHGTPITPESVMASLEGRHFLVSFRHPEQVGAVMEVCSSWMADNGAFTAWRSGHPVTNWAPYYDWAAIRSTTCEAALIPDIIDGSEADNDTLVREWPHGSLGVPVWHLHESLDRLERLAAAWHRVALGSSGDFATPGNQAWWRRMDQAMEVVTDRDGFPLVKLHGLRMLDSALSALPLSSADSCNVARNIGLDSRWTGSYHPATKAARAIVLADRIERVEWAQRWQGIPTTLDLFGREVA